jgi:SAM-dependent methyltransferase
LAADDSSETRGPVLDRLLRVAGLGGAARAIMDFVDLQWSLTIEALARVAPRTRGRLLDVGCGDKPYLHLFEPYVSEYVGVEHEASFRETHTASRSPADGSRGADVLYDGQRLPFEDGSFDTVLCIQVLEHTPRPWDLVREIARVARPDGLVVLMAPFSFRLHEEPHDYFRFSPHGLRELCAGAGLRVLEVTPLGSLWSLVGHKLNTYLALRVAHAGAIGQGVGKLGHEGAIAEAPRLWTLPIVAPAIAAVAVAARALDRIAPDPSESLGFLLLAEHDR